MSVGTQLFLTTYLCGTVTTISINKFDDTSNLIKLVKKKHRQLFGVQRIGDPEVIVVINATVAKISRLNGKVSDQFKLGDGVILVTEDDWKKYARDHFTPLNSPVRHGKILIPRSPAVLSALQLREFIAAIVDIVKPDETARNIDESKELLDSDLSINMTCEKGIQTCNTFDEVDSCVFVENNVVANEIMSDNNLEIPEISNITCDDNLDKMEQHGDEDCSLATEALFRCENDSLQPDLVDLHSECISSNDRVISDDNNLLTNNNDDLIRKKLLALIYEIIGCIVNSSDSDSILVENDIVCPEEDPILEDMGVNIATEILSSSVVNDESSQANDWSGIEMLATESASLEYVSNFASIDEVVHDELSIDNSCNDSNNSVDQELNHVNDICETMSMEPCGISMETLSSSVDCNPIFESSFNEDYVDMFNNTFTIEPELSNSNADIEQYRQDSFDEESEFSHHGESGEMDIVEIVDVVEVVEDREGDNCGESNSLETQIEPIIEGFNQFENNDENNDEYIDCDRESSNQETNDVSRESNTQDQLDEYRNDDIEEEFSSACFQEDYLLSNNCGGNFAMEDVSIIIEEIDSLPCDQYVNLPLNEQSVENFTQEECNFNTHCISHFVSYILPVVKNLRSELNAIEYEVLEMSALMNEDFDQLVKAVCLQIVRSESLLMVDLDCETQFPYPPNSIESAATLSPNLPLNIRRIVNPRGENHPYFSHEDDATIAEETEDDNDCIIVHDVPPPLTVVDSNAENVHDCTAVDMDIQHDQSEDIRNDEPVDENECTYEDLISIPVMVDPFANSVDEIPSDSSESSSTKSTSHKRLLLRERVSSRLTKLLTSDKEGQDKLIDSNLSIMPNSHELNDQGGDDEERIVSDTKTLGGDFSCDGYSNDHEALVPLMNEIIDQQVSDTSLIENIAIRSGDVENDKNPLDSNDSIVIDDSNDVDEVSDKAMNYSSLNDNTPVIIEQHSQESKDIDRSNYCWNNDVMDVNQSFINTSEDDLKLFHEDSVDESELEVEVPSSIDVVDNNRTAETCFGSSLGDDRSTDTNSLETMHFDQENINILSIPECTVDYGEEIKEEMNAAKRKNLENISCMRMNELLSNKLDASSELDETLEEQEDTHISMDRMDDSLSLLTDSTPEESMSSLKTDENLMTSSTSSFSKLLSKGSEIVSSRVIPRIKRKVTTEDYPASFQMTGYTGSTPIVSLHFPAKLFESDLYDTDMQVLDEDISDHTDSSSQKEGFDGDESAQGGKEELRLMSPVSQTPIKDELRMEDLQSVTPLKQSSSSLALAIPSDHLEIDVEDDCHRYYLDCSGFPNFTSCERFYFPFLVFLYRNRSHGMASPTMSRNRSLSFSFMSQNNHKSLLSDAMLLDDCIHHCDISADLSRQDSLLWAIFQLYSSNDKAICQSIRLCQVVRMLKDAGINFVSSSQLYLSFSNYVVSTLYVSPPKQKKANGMGNGRNGVSTTARTSSTRQSCNSNSIVLFDSFRSLPSILKKFERRKSPSRSPGSSIVEEFGSMYNEYFLTLLSQKCKEFDILMAMSKLCWSGILSHGYDESLSYRLAVVLEKEYAISLYSQQSYEWTNEYNDIIELCRRGHSRHKTPQHISFNRNISDHVKRLWDKNMDQIRQIFSLYAKEPGSFLSVNESPGSVGARPKLLMTFDDVKELLLDFNILPTYVDLLSLSRLFLSVKMWEWMISDSLISHFLHVDGGMIDRLDIIQDPLEFLTSRDALALTLAGFIELLTRLSCVSDIFGNQQLNCVSTLLHLMDVSSGKAKLANISKNRVLSLKNFAYK